MRCCVLVLALLPVLAAPSHAATRCSAPPPRGPLGFADSIYVKGSCGTFALRPDGVIEVVHPSAWAPSWAERALARADDTTYIAHPHRHLALLRDGRTLWRSALPHGSDNVALSGDAIAFTAYSHDHPEIWVARVGEPEQLVARREDLLGAAATGGFFTQRGHELRVRAADGTVRNRLGRVYAFTYDRPTKTLVGMTDAHRLIRTDGRTVRTLAWLKTVGHAWPSWLEVLPNGLIDIQMQNRRVFLRPDGSFFASAVLSRKAITVSGAVPMPERSGVAFATHRDGEDRVLLLERGHRVPRVLYERRAGPMGCGYGVGLALRGDQLLYSSSNGRGLAVLDVRGRREARDLWPVVHRIPGFRGHATIRRVSWASTWNG